MANSEEGKGAVGRWLRSEQASGDDPVPWLLIGFAHTVSRCYSIPLPKPTPDRRS
jgi:hypothetical protein